MLHLDFSILLLAKLYDISRTQQVFLFTAAQFYSINISLILLLCVLRLKFCTIHKLKDQTSVCLQRCVKVRQ